MKEDKISLTASLIITSFTGLALWAGLFLLIKYFTGKG